MKPIKLKKVRLVTQSPDIMNYETDVDFEDGEAWLVDNFVIIPERYGRPLIIPAHSVEMMVSAEILTIEESTIEELPRGKRQQKKAAASIQ